jgi:hypothetical protein
VIKKMKPVFIFAISIICAGKIQSQQLFTENFDSAALQPQWQIITGNWHIADVQELRIAPAENCRQFVLRSDSAGYIQLFIDLPSFSKDKKLQFSFSYYTYAKGSAPRVEAEFYKKEMKDGIRGKPMTWVLPLKGMWAPYTKTLTIPTDANQFRVVFFNPRSSPAGKAPCLDVIAVSLLK